jgi:hypothetical protein
MTRISTLSGIKADATARLRTSYPINLEPVIAESGLSDGYLHSPPGVTLISTGPGRDRGAINWNGACYRVMGSKLVRIDGSVVTVLGEVGDNGGPVSMDYSFDRLAIASNGKLFYWNGSSLAQVTDPDLGLVLDVIWIAGYFMTTDGTNLVVTELSDPFAVNPLKYGSSEESPDQIVSLIKIRGEVYAINQTTTENFQNVGGSGFPFARNNGGLIPKGTIGTYAKAHFLDTFACVGASRNERASVYLGVSAQALPISTPEIDRILGELSDGQLSTIELEAVVDANEQRLLVHLPDKTLVYSHQASRRAEQSVWHIRASGIMADQAYAPRHAVLTNGQWIVGSLDGMVGYMDESVQTHFGIVAGWQFDTALIYNDGRGVLIKALELFGVPGACPFGSDPTAFLSITQDGRTWGQERAISLGKTGESRKRMQWRPKIMVRAYAGLRFRGANTAIASFSRLEADLEALTV